MSVANVKYDFHGKNALVTGGAQGIGLEIAREFLAAGASVMIWDRSEQALQSAREALASFAGRVHFSSVDIAKMESCRVAVGQLPFKIHFLINNAGITRDKTFVKMSPEDFDAVIQVNLVGQFNVTKSLFDSFHPDSVQRRIVNLASIVGIYGNFGQTNYAAAKAGVIGMTKTLARELGRKGFTVNAIAPGFIQTSMTAQMPKEAIDGMVAKIPAGRMGRTSDIANACLFICTEEASYIHGVTLTVDGGLVF